MIILKNSIVFEYINDIFKKFPSKRGSGEGTWGEVEKLPGYFICIGKGTYDKPASFVVTNKNGDKEKNWSI